MSDDQPAPPTRPAQLADFEPLVGSTFVFSIEGIEQTVEAELIEAALGKGDKLNEDDRDPFCLVFRLPPDKQLGQHSYNVTHSETGSTTIMFLVPFKADSDGYYMEAIFN